MAGFVQPYELTRPVPDQYYPGGIVAQGIDWNVQQHAEIAAGENSGVLPDFSRVFGVYSANGTIILPAGYAIYDVCVLETGGGSTSQFSFGTTPQGSNLFSMVVNANKFTALSLQGIKISQPFFSAALSTTIYVSNAGQAWGSMVVNISMLIVNMAASRLPPSSPASYLLDDTGVRLDDGSGNMLTT